MQSIFYTADQPHRGWTFPLARATINLFVQPTPTTHIKSPEKNISDKASDSSDEWERIEQGFEEESNIPQNQSDGTSLPLALDKPIVLINPQQAPSEIAQEIIEQNQKSHTMPLSISMTQYTNNPMLQPNVTIDQDTSQAQTTMPKTSYKQKAKPLYYQLIHTCCPCLYISDRDDIQA
jgi:hypothetical protein